MSAAPLLIARIAGLPAEALTPFSHPSLLAELDERERLQRRLDDLRAALVDRLHAAIRRDSSAERRFLLAVKRRCFNAGSLAPYREDPLWPLLTEVAPPAVESIVALEDALAAADRRAGELYGRALLQERRSLVQLLENRSFLRGLTLASPVVARNLGSLHRQAPGGFGRREKRLCLTLLRYLSRAALKPTPFSTLTRAGLAAANGCGDFALAASETWRERSTASLHHELLAQCSCLLLRCRRFAEGLPAMLNETLTVAGDGRASFFHPGRWELDKESRTFELSEASFIRARLEGPLVSWLLAALRGGPRLYRDLLAGARAHFSAEDFEEIEDGLRELRKLGLWSLVLPWDFNAPDLAGQILDRLEERPDVPELRAFRSGLRELADLLRGYAGAGSPVRLLEEQKERAEGLFRTLLPPAELPQDIRFQANEANFEEEVFLRPETGGPAVLQLAEERARGLLEDLEPLVRLMHLHSTTHDFLLTLAAFVERRWPGAAEIGLLELFGATQPLFEQYRRYHRGTLVSSAAVDPGFNPLALDAVERLTGWRREVEVEVRSDLREDAGAQRLCPRTLSALLDRVPPLYTRAHDFCAFVQPADGRGREWVLNTLTEGYGRYGSRFTAGMDEESRRLWISRFLPLSELDLGGETVELIDLSFPGLRTLNAHAVQTRRVLKMPGEGSALPPERVLRLSDLRVRPRGVDGLPVLMDTAGQRLLPVAFGSLAARRRPTLLKFIAIFGPAELLIRRPMRSPLPFDGGETFDRHAIGRVVYSRRKWHVDARPLLAASAGRSEAEAFAAIHRWRVSKGLPDRVFARQPNPGAVSFFKPQYLDFSSPTFVQMLVSILRSAGEALMLEEALPPPEGFPAQGGLWGVEIQLESFAFRQGCSSPPRRVRGGQQHSPHAGRSERSLAHEEESGIHQ
jgi:hypothetical protein